MEFNDPTRSNKQYFVVGQPLNWRDEYNLDPLVSREINDDFVVLIEVFKQDPDMGVKNFHPSIDDDRKATDSDKEGNNDENTPKTPYYGENMNDSYGNGGNNDEDAPERPYDGENMNAYSNKEGNNYEVAPDPPTNDVNINANSDDGRNIYEVTRDTPTNGGNNENLTIMNKIIIKKILIRKQIMKT